MKISKPEFLAKVAHLTEEEQERLLSRMEGKLPKRLHKEKISREEALAIQLELEDEQLQEWRDKMREINRKALESAKKQKSKATEKDTKDKNDAKVEKEKGVVAKPAAKPAAKPTVASAAKVAQKSASTAKASTSKASALKSSKSKKAST